MKTNKSRKKKKEMKKNNHIQHHVKGTIEVIIIIKRYTLLSTPDTSIFSHRKLQQPIAQ